MGLCVSKMRCINDVLLSQRLLACLLVKSEEENNGRTRRALNLSLVQPYRRLTVKALHRSLAALAILPLHRTDIADTSEASYRGSYALGMGACERRQRFDPDANRFGEGKKEK